MSNVEKPPKKPTALTAWQTKATIKAALAEARPESTSDAVYVKGSETITLSRCHGSDTGVSKHGERVSARFETMVALTTASGIV